MYIAWSNDEGWGNGYWGEHRTWSAADRGATAAAREMWNQSPPPFEIDDTDHFDRVDDWDEFLRAFDHANREGWVSQRAFDLVDAERQRMGRRAGR